MSDHTSEARLDVCGRPQPGTRLPMDQRSNGNPSTPPPPESPEGGEMTPPDPDAPGNYVDDEDAADVPEPNEPA